MKIIISEEQYNRIFERKIHKFPYYHKEDPTFKDNDIYYYEPTQDQVDDFIKDKFQIPDDDYIDSFFKEKHIKKNKAKKEKILKPKNNGYAYLYYLSQQMGYGPIALMRWKKRTILDNNPIEGKKFNIIPDTGEIKPHNINRYFYF